MKVTEKDSKYYVPFIDDIRRLYGAEIYTHNSKRGGQHVQSVRHQLDIIHEEYYVKISASMCDELSDGTQESKYTLEEHLKRSENLC